MYLYIGYRYEELWGWLELHKSKILLIPFFSILIVLINITEVKLFEFADMQKCAETGILLYFYTFIGIHDQCMLFGLLGKNSAQNDQTCEQKKLPLQTKIRKGKKI